MVPQKLTIWVLLTDSYSVTNLVFCYILHEVEANLNHKEYAYPHFHKQEVLERFYAIIFLQIPSFE
jgi:hypothetical protein